MSGKGANANNAPDKGANANNASGKGKNANNASRKNKKANNSSNKNKKANKTARNNSNSNNSNSNNNNNSYLYNSNNNSNNNNTNTEELPGRPPAPRTKAPVEEWEAWIKSYISTLSDWDRKELGINDLKLLGMFHHTFVEYRDAEIRKLKDGWRIALMRGDDKKYIEIMKHNFKVYAYFYLTQKRHPKLFRKTYYD